MKKMTEAELKQIAVDLYDGKIFSDRHFSGPEETKNLISVVFMPLGMGVFKTKKQVANLGMVYEYLDKAGPRAINGFPMFISCRFLNKADAKKMFGFFEEYKKLKNSFMAVKK